MKATAFIRKSASKNDTNSVATNINKPNAKNPLHEKYFNYLSSWHDTQEKAASFAPSPKNKEKDANNQ